MNSLRNKVQLIGNLGMNPEIRITESGRKLARVSLATNETWKNNRGERITETQWHNIVAWGKTADLMEQYLQKGSEVMVEGKLVNRNYVDKNGIKRYIIEIEAQAVLMLNKSPNGNTEAHLRVPLP